MGSYWSHSLNTLILLAIHVYTGNCPAISWNVKHSCPLYFNLPKFTVEVKIESFHFIFFSIRLNKQKVLVLQKTLLLTAYIFWIVQVNRIFHSASPSMNLNLQWPLDSWYLFGVFSPSQEFFTHLETSLSVKGYEF